MSIFTLTRQELYDYGRCPKIVAIKIYKSYVMPKPVRETAKLLPEIPPDMLGKLGELGVKMEFDEGIPRAKKESALLKELERRGIEVDDEVRAMIRETTHGLERIRADVEREFGTISIIGRGETRYGASTAYGRPDFVAFSSATRKPILIEVKNTSTQQTSHTFQAQFYNTMLSTVGVTICSDHKEGKKFSIKPSIQSGYDAESLLVYPRLGESTRVKETIDLSTNTIKEIWRAKELGLLGKTPATNCDSDCPHFRLKVDLPEDNIEVAPPLALVYAKGLTEKKAQIDEHYMDNYVRERAYAARDAFWEFRGTKVESTAKEKLAQVLAKWLDLPISEAMALMAPDFGRNRRLSWPDTDQVMREMVDEFSKWKKILGKKKSKELGSKSSGQATRIYTLPSNSEDFINQSWDKW